MLDPQKDISTYEVNLVPSNETDDDGSYLTNIELRKSNAPREKKIRFKEEIETGITKVKDIKQKITFQKRKNSDVKKASPIQLKKSLKGNYHQRNGSMNIIQNIKRMEFKQQDFNRNHLEPSKASISTDESKSELIF